MLKSSSSWLRNKQHHSVDQQRVDSETGSVAIALMIMMIIALLGAAALSRSQQTLHHSQQLDQRAAAEAGAERSLAEAVSRLNNGEPLPFKGEGELIQGSFFYRVERTDEQTVQIRAEAEINGVHRAIDARLEGSVRYGFSLFTNSWLVSDDNQGRISGAIGSNGTIKFNGSEPGDTQEIFSPNGTCEECQNLIKSEGPFLTQEPEFPTGPVQKCADEIVFNEVVDGQGGVPFVCETKGEAVIFKGELKVENPPLIVYVGEWTTLMFYEATVNIEQPSSDVQIYVRTNEKERTLFLGQTSTISANIYAPGRDFVPLDFSLRGSLTVRSLEIRSKGVVSIEPDLTNISQEPGNWTITSWQMSPELPRR